MLDVSFLEAAGVECLETETLRLGVAKNSTEEFPGTSDAAVYLEAAGDECLKTGALVDAALDVGLGAAGESLESDNLELT